MKKNSQKNIKIEDRSHDIRHTPRGRAGKASFFTQSEDGKYVYNGRLYKLQEGQRFTAAQASRIRNIFGAALLILSAAAGCLPVEGMKNTFYVIIPYMAVMISSVSVVWAIVRMAYWGQELREYVYKATAARLPARCMITAITAVLTFSGEILFIIRSDVINEIKAIDIIFILINILIFIFSLILRRLEVSLIWREF